MAETRMIRAYKIVSSVVDLGVVGGAGAIGTCRTSDDKDSGNRCLRCIQIFSVRIVLEVFGGTGAVWGCSEILTLRNPGTLWFWRPVSLSIGLVFFLRWLIELFDYWCEITVVGCMSQIRGVRTFQIFSARLVLEVFGGAGAIWGSSDALALRNSENSFIWRPIAIIFGFIFTIRWMRQMLEHVIEAKYRIAGRRDQYTGNLDRFLGIFPACLVLEVFGSTGALWGFSEALALRNSATVWFWRPTALAIGTFFFSRWLFQISSFITDIKHSSCETLDGDMVERRGDDESSELRLEAECGSSD